MLSTTPTVPTAEFEARTGWSFMPEGACKGEVCIPLASPPGDTVDLAEIAAAMQLPLVHDEAHGVWAVGPESIGDKTLTTAEAPDLTLPRIDPGHEGETFRLSSLRGQKVLLVAWAPY
jgi:hypothetical protein